MNSRQALSLTPSRDGLIAAAIATIANLIVLGAGRAAGVTFQVPGWDPAAGPVQIGPLQVAITTIVPLLLGGALVALLTARPRRVRALLIVAGIAAALSLAAPLSLEAETATRLLLAVMHVVAGAVFIGSMRRHAQTQAIKASATDAASHSENDGSFAGEQPAT